MEYHELAHEVFLLGVGAYAVESAFVVGYGLIGAGFGVGGHFDGGEHLLDFAFDAVYVDVTHHYDSLLVGAIPCLVIVAQGLRLEVVHHIHDADGQTAAIFGGGEEVWEYALEDAHLALHAATPFFMDYAAFFVDFLGGKCQVVGPVVEYEQTGVLHALAGDRHVGYVVDSLVDGGVGVEVGSEFYAYRFEPLAQLVVWEVGGAVKAHVLQEVGQSALVFFFQGRAYLLGYVEVGLPLGILVVTDVIGKSVGELADAHIFVDRQRLCHGVVAPWAIALCPAASRTVRAMRAVFNKCFM